MGEILDSVNRFVWGFPAMILIVIVGVLLSIRTRAVQFRLFPAAIRTFFRSFLKKQDKNGVSPYRALCTALAATVGTGNLAGVGGAIAIGGPGAIFWMWICALLGMVTKFAEVTLSVHYRVKDRKGNYIGGPMYIVQQGLSAKWRPLAIFYCVFGVIAAFGIGSATQVNAVIGGINSAVRAFGGRESTNNNIILGIALAILTTLVLLGGAKRIGSVASFLVPFASVFYILLCIVVLILRSYAVPQAFGAIIRGAFSPEAVTGGVLWSVFQTLRIGASRGIFTNEAGMGTAGIAHSAAQVNHPVEQGLMGIIEVFIDTIVICTMTGLVILCSGISVPYGQDLGIQITSGAFSAVFGSWITVPLAISLCCFAIATIIGWGLYGMRCVQFLVGERAFHLFVIMQGISVVLGSVIGTGDIWALSEAANGLMVIPNLLVLLFMIPELTSIIKEYESIYGSRSANGGTYENFKQSKSM